MCEGLRARPGSADYALMYAYVMHLLQGPRSDQFRLGPLFLVFLPP